MPKTYAVIVDGPLGMSHELARYADALYLVKLLSPEGQRVLGEILQEFTIAPEFDEMVKLLQRQFKKRFNDAAFQAYLDDEPNIKLSDGEEFLDLKEFCAREPEVKRVDWEEVFVAFNMTVTPVPMRSWHWSDAFPEFDYLPSPIKGGDLLRVDAVSDVLHICPRTEEQIEEVEMLYGAEQELDYTAVEGIVIKVDWADTYTVAYTPNSPRPQQIYIVSGHVEWERLDAAVRTALYKELDWDSDEEPFGVAVAYLYTQGDTALKVLETVDGRDFAKPDKMRIRVPESDWTVEVFLRSGDVLSLACDVQRPNFSDHFPNAGDALKRMQLPEVYFSIYPINEMGLEDDEEEDIDEEEFRTLFAIFGFLKDGQFALRYLSGGDTQMFVDAATKTIQIELLMKINIWGDGAEDFEIERLDPLGGIENILDVLEDFEETTEANPKPLSFEKSAWWQSYLKDLSKKMDEDDEPESKPKSRKKSGDDEPKPKGRKKPKGD